MKQINENDLSQQSKDFIRKFKKMDQSKYNELTRKVETSNRPITASQAEYIMS